ncbi:hypothetical protein BDM02DRAFT_2968174 [Thelephora ganbajun]|uniref:Uncharacterized protein n=1 Tax=Thelephora ganbajun TaxID=370292 RepID=A0ACB6ZS68_THEGA|nr:hypothetical protein BDM02DRAFT_2968174 [Thelephora ganbajun]
MAEFSWSDSVKAALAPCLSCLSFASRVHRNDRPSSRNSSRPDLDRLLQDVDTDTEAETLSLHSNIGDSRRKRKKKRGPPKSITLFGYNLFGKPPIRLEGGDDLTAAIISPVGGRGPPNAVKKSMSTSTLDSDAAPLDPSTIAQLSAAQSPSGPSGEELRRKEERRRRRRERKERKEALARAMGRTDAEFEGFPGSGPGVPPPLSPPEFVFVSPTYPNEELVEDADFDAEAYNTRRHIGSTRSESDSRSRTSASTSNPDSSYYNHHHSQQPPPTPAPSTQGQNSHDAPPKKRKSSRPKGSSKSSSSKTSQSPSIRSPVESFPSTGFGGGRMSRKNSEMGVFLARRGDDY